MSSVAQASIVAHGPLVCYLCRLIHCENWVLSIVFEKVRGTTFPKNFEMGGGNINFINFNSLSIYFFICGCKKKMFSVRKSTGEGEQALVPPLP